jgi:uncharacterized protein YqeY
MAAMDLQQRLGDELKSAMRSGDPVRRDAIRMLRAALKNEEIELQHTLSDDESQQVVARIAKRHHESIEQFQQGGRSDLVEHEQAQLSVVEEFLPTPMSRDEIEAEVRAALSTVDATGPRAHGAVMRALEPKLRAKANLGLVSMRDVNEIVRAMLSAGEAQGR